MPIKNISHKYFGGVGSRKNKVKYSDKIAVQTRTEIIIAAVIFFFQTEVSTSKTMAVTGSA